MPGPVSQFSSYSCPISCEQAEKASKQRKWAEAEDDYIKALWVEPTANAVNLALWLGLCQAQLALKKGAEAVKSCTAVRAWPCSPPSKTGATDDPQNSSRVSIQITRGNQHLFESLYLARVQSMSCQ